MPKPKVELSLFNRTEAAHYLGVDRGYINLLIEQGELIEIQLPFQTTFKGRRIPKKICDEFIDRNLVGWGNVVGVIYFCNRTYDIS